jgi:hypothetical protein
VRETSLSSAFLLVWWLVGISPAFVSVPPASLGHTILAQPAVYLILALPIWQLARTLPQKQNWVAYAAALILVVAVAVRDLPDYFVEWPQRGMTRFLYRADIRDLAHYLNAEPEMQDFAISGLLAGPWDKIALDIDLDDERAKSVHARWYDPRRALMLVPGTAFAGYPAVDALYSERQVPVPEADRIGGYQLMQTPPELTADLPVIDDPVCFENGLCWAGAHYDPRDGRLDLLWAVAGELDLPEMPLISNPPPPGVYAGPRLLVFAQLQGANGNFLAGDDGLWVDPQTLRAGDRFIQQHRLETPGEAAGAAVVFGLYDPLTGERLLTLDGQDHLRLPIGESVPAAGRARSQEDNTCP